MNINSLEKVIRDYLKKAEQCTENARDKSIQAVTDVDDLDNITTPESIMLRFVTNLAMGNEFKNEYILLVPYRVKMLKIGQIEQF